MFALTTPFSHHGSSFSRRGCLSDAPPLAHPLQYHARQQQEGTSEAERGKIDRRMHLRFYPGIKARGLQDGNFREDFRASCSVSVGCIIFDLSSQKPVTLARLEVDHPAIFMFWPLVGSLRGIQ